MCSPHQLNRLTLVVDRRQGDVELDGKLEPSLLRRQKHHFGIDLDVSGLQLLTPGDRAHGALEAGSEADCEVLLWVRASPLPAQLRREAQLYLWGSVRRAAVAFEPGRP